MEQDTQKFLEAEKKADELVETLKKLKSEVESYDTASKELNIVREDLEKFLTSTKEIADDSHEALNTIKSIGGPEILDRLKKIEDRQQSDTKRLTIILSVIIVLTVSATIVQFFI